MFVLNKLFIITKAIISRRRGRQPSWGWGWGDGGEQPLILLMFKKKLHEIKKTLVRWRGGGGVLLGVRSLYEQLRAILSDISESLIAETWNDVKFTITVFYNMPLKQTI